MKKEEKGRIIDELSQKFSSCAYFYITDASGMTVENVNKFRKLCYSKGIEYKVVKNTLIKKALERTETDYSPFHGTVLKGFSGVLFAETGNAPARLLKEFYSQGNEKPLLKGASVNTELYIGVDQLEALVNLKSKDELIGDIIGLLQSPAKNIISGLQNNGGQTIAGVLKTLSEKPE